MAGRDETASNAAVRPDCRRSAETASSTAVTRDRPQLIEETASNAAVCEEAAGDAAVHHRRSAEENRLRCSSFRCCCNDTWSTARGRCPQGSSSSTSSSPSTGSIDRGYSAYSVRCWSWWLVARGCQGHAATRRGCGVAGVRIATAVD